MTTIGDFNRGPERDVSFVVEPNPGVHVAFDAAYRAKYDQYGARMVGTVVGPEVEAVTIHPPDGPDTLATMLWAKSSQERARATLRRTLATPRGAIGSVLATPVRAWPQWCAECPKGRRSGSRVRPVADPSLL